MLRSKMGAIGAILYLLVAGGAFAYSLSDGSIYAIAYLLLMSWPWIGFLQPILGIAVNAVIIYFVLAGLALLVSSLRRSRMSA